MAEPVTAAQFVAELRHYGYIGPTQPVTIVHMQRPATRGEETPRG